MATDVNAAFAAVKVAQLDERRALRDAAIQSEGNKAAWIAAEVAAGRPVRRRRMPGAERPPGRLSDPAP